MIALDTNILFFALTLTLPPGEREPVSWIVQEAKYFVGLRWSNGVVERWSAVS